MASFLHHNHIASRYSNSMTCPGTATPSNSLAGEGLNAFWSHMPEQQRSPIGERRWFVVIKAILLIFDNGGDGINDAATPSVDPAPF